MLRERPWKPCDWPAPESHLKPDLVILDVNQDPEDHTILTTAILLVAAVLLLVSWFLYGPSAV